MTGTGVMHRVLLAAPLLAVSFAPALAGDAVMAGYFGNTVVSTGGILNANTRYHADHTFSVTGSGFGMTRTFVGTWAIDGSGQICRSFAGETPPGLPTTPLCTPIEAHKLGDSWTATRDGTTRTMTMKAGLQ